MDKQRGISLLGLIIVLCFVGCVVYLGARLTPLYVDNFAIKSTLKSLKTDSIVKQEESPSQNQQNILVYVARALRVNSITYVPLKRIKIKRVSGGFVVRVAYDARVKIIANIDAVVSFDDQVRIKAK